MLRLQVLTLQIGHLIMNINQNRTIFHQAIMDSGAHTARAIHPPSSKLNEEHFKEFLALTGCDGRADDETLPCLRRASSSSITEASFAVFTKSDPSVRWAWQPVQDGNIISRRPIDAWKSGKWNKVPILTGHAHNEGSYYAPRSLSTSQDFEDFFSTLLPQLSNADLKELCELYPDPAKPGSPYLDTRPIPAGRQYKRGEAAYGQYAYVCPVRQTAHLGTANPDNPPVFLYHWAVNKTVMFGANHGDQPPYETYNPEVRSISETQDAIAGYLHAYMTSFIVSGDPNKVPGRYPERPRWESFSAFDAEKQRTMIFGMGNDERAGGDSKGFVAQFVKEDWAEAECNFWWKQSSNFED